MSIDPSEIAAFNQFLAQLGHNGGTPESLEAAVRAFRKHQSKHQSKHTASAVIDPRDQTMGPATTDFTKRLRALRKQHLAAGGRLLNMDEIDQVVADAQGLLSGQE